MVYTNTDEGEQKLLRRAITLLQEKLAEDILILKLEGLCAFADYFLLCNAQTEKHAQALCDYLAETLKKEEKIKPLHIEGYHPGHWILMDYVSILVHIFIPSSREYYGLERLWGDAPDVTQDYL